MRAGLLRDSLIVERLSEPYSADNAVLTADSAIVSTDSATIDEYGNQAPHAWATQIAAQPAHIMPMGGDEAMRADRLTVLSNSRLCYGGRARMLLSWRRTVSCLPAMVRLWRPARH